MLTSIFAWIDSLCLYELLIFSLIAWCIGGALINFLFWRATDRDRAGDFNDWEV